MLRGIILPVLIGIIVLGFIGFSQDVYAIHFSPKPTELTMQYTSDPIGAIGTTFTVTDTNGNSVDNAYNTTPDPVIVSDGQTFTVSPQDGDSELKTKTAFYINGMQFDFDHIQGDPDINTSCSEPLFTGLTATVIDGGIAHTLTLESWKSSGDVYCLLALPHLPPAIMCGPGTILNDENKCIPNPDDIVTCDLGTTTLNIDTNECEADVTQEDLDLLQNIIDGLHLVIAELEALLGGDSPDKPTPQEKAIEKANKAQIKADNAPPEKQEKEQAKACKKIQKEINHLTKKGITVPAELQQLITDNCS